MQYLSNCVLDWMSVLTKISKSAWSGNWYSLRTGIILMYAGYSKKKADSGFSEQTQPRFYIVNPTGTHVHLLNGWQTGTREPRSFILPVEWKAMSLDPNRKDLRRDHA